MENKQPELWKSNTLAELAVRIRTEHEMASTHAQQSRDHMQQSRDHMQQSLAHAMTAGDLLIEAKRLLQHGEWSGWIRDNCQIADRTVRQYMRLAKNRIVIEKLDATNMSISTAIQLLVPPGAAVVRLLTPPKDDDVQLDDEKVHDNQIEAQLQAIMNNGDVAISMAPFNCDMLKGEITQEIMIKAQDVIDTWIRARNYLLSLAKK
jgi:hypothetical protein